MTGTGSPIRIRNDPDWIPKCRKSATNFVANFRHFGVGPVWGRSGDGRSSGRATHDAASGDRSDTIRGVELTTPKRSLFMTRSAVTGPRRGPPVATAQPFRRLSSGHPCGPGTGGPTTDNGGRSGEVAQRSDVPGRRAVSRFSLTTALRRVGAGLALVLLLSACGDSSDNSTADAASLESDNAAGAADSDGDGDGASSAGTAGLAASDHSDGSFGADEPDEPEGDEPEASASTSTSTTAEATTTVPTTAPAEATPVCGPIVTEDFDPTSSQHVLPGAVEPIYFTDPPTSGPHTAGPAFTGVLDTTLDRPVQIGVMEAGGVIIHHNGLTDEEAALLVPLTETESVSLMSNDVLEPGQVVATAWLHKITCDGADPEAISEFVAARLNAFDEGH